MLTTSNGLPVQIRPVNNISPFTYRDGETYLEILYRLRDYIENTVRPEFNTEIARIVDEFNTGLSTTGGTVTTALAEWETRFTEFMADVTANIAELNDAAIAQLIGQPASETAAALTTFIENEITAAVDALIGPRVIYPDRAPYNVKFNGDKTPATVAANTAGMQAALDAAAATGGTVQPPPGLCWTTGDLAVGSYTRLIGAGKGATTFKILDGTSWNNRVFYIKAGSTRSSIEHLSVDGNIQNRTEVGKLGDIYGTNISVINSTHCKIDSVESVWAPQHCFDVTTPAYGNAGDGAVIPNPSEFIDFIDCFADMHGDDGFTTHGSGHITFTRCRAGGSRKALEVAYDNGNGFEFDDYSYDITATECYATGNAHGFEIKAHTNMSAARNVRLVNCMSEKNEVNYSLRHIGHHLAGTPDSLTAKNVQIIGCISRFPTRVFFGGVDVADGDVPDDQTPPGDEYMGLQIGGYRGVTVTNFHHIGDPTYNYAGASAILIHFKAEDVTIDGYHIEGHTTGDWDIYAVGGPQPCKNIIIGNGHHRDSARGAISAGGESNAIIQNVRIQRAVPGSPNSGTCVRAYGQKTVRNVKIKTETPWTYPFNISDVYYSSYETPLAANTTIAGPPA